MRILLLLVLLALPAFFAAVEVALLRLRTSRVRVLNEQGVPGAAAVQRLQRRMRRALLMCQLGTSLSLLALGWTGSGLARDWWQASGSAATRWWDLGWFLLLVWLSTLVAGLLPRAWVLNHPERAALSLAPVLEAVLRSSAVVVVARRGGFSVASDRGSVLALGFPWLSDHCG